MLKVLYVDRLSVLYLIFYNREPLLELLCVLIIIIIGSLSSLLCSSSPLTRASGGALEGVVVDLYDPRALGDDWLLIYRIRDLLILLSTDLVLVGWVQVVVLRGALLVLLLFLLVL